MSKQQQAASAASTQTAKRGQQAKAKAAVERVYPAKLPAGFATHGQWAADGTIVAQGIVPATTAFLATPKKLGIPGSVGIPGNQCEVAMLPMPTGVSAVYTSAYNAYKAAHAKACEAHKVKYPTVAQIEACMGAWPVTRNKAGSAKRHVARSMGIAWRLPS